MKTPYEILETSEDADDEAIKKAYLKKVREFPPERDGDAFQRIRKAYELIQTEKLRFEYKLFHYEKPEYSSLSREVLRATHVVRPPEKAITDVVAEFALNGFFRLTE